MVKRPVPYTLLIGVGVLLFAETLLFYDVHLRHGLVVETQGQVDALLSQPSPTWLADLARTVAINMTPIAWTAYLIALEGLLAWQASGSPVRKRPHHFFLLFLASILIWCVFDFVNFHGGMKAWLYIGIPTRMADKFAPYFLAFGSIVPGMLMTAQAMLNAHWFDWAKTRPRQLPNWLSPLSILIGVAMLIWPLLHPDPITNLTLWTSFVFLLDPINQKFRRPSMFADWQLGWYGRTLSLFTAGLLCGFLWEFWNYWALAKWTYHLPFLGSWNHYHYFEMPLPGLIGFIPFGLECWVMWQTMRIPLTGLAEELPNSSSVI